MTQYIDGAAFKAMLIHAAAKLEIQKQQINELNVFPVPDGDTGTNMCLTLNAAAAELKKEEQKSLTKAADIAASALLRGARGNSGVILSLLFRGIARSLRGKDKATAAEFADAMAEGVSAAYKAVMKPAEGTILTVSRLSAESAKAAAAEKPDIEEMLKKAVASAKEALANTVNINPVLKKAGVIDAGGKGYTVILEAMLGSVRGEKTEETEAPAEIKEKADFSQFETDDITFGYCTEFIVKRESTKKPQLLRSFLDKLGDSLVLVDDDEIIKVHVHTNAPGTVITEALTYGSLLTVKIENMREQHSETISGTAEAENIAEPEKKYGLVAVCAGEGIEAVFRDLGIDEIVSGGQTMNPSTDDILKKINATPAEYVFVFPNNKNIIMAAEQCAGLTPKKVIVIPTMTIPQGIASLLFFDPELEEGELSEKMREASEKVRTVQITYAARDSEYDGHKIHEGDFLALLEGKIIAIDKDLSLLLDIIGDSLTETPHEFITIFYGADVTQEKAEESMQQLQERLCDAEITLISGGQPVYHYIISAE